MRRTRPSLCSPSAHAARPAPMLPELWAAGQQLLPPPATGETVLKYHPQSFGSPREALGSFQRGRQPELGQDRHCTGTEFGDKTLYLLQHHRALTPGGRFSPSCPCCWHCPAPSRSSGEPARAAARGPAAPRLPKKMAALLTHRPTALIYLPGRGRPAVIGRAAEVPAGIGWAARRTLWIG